MTSIGSVIFERDHERYEKWMLWIVKPIAIAAWKVLRISLLHSIVYLYKSDMPQFKSIVSARIDYLEDAQEAS